MKTSNKQKTEHLYRGFAAKQFKFSKYSDTSIIFCHNHKASLLHDLK